MLAVRTGLEPATPCVTGMYSNQLNYRTNVFMSVACRLKSVAKIVQIFKSARVLHFFQKIFVFSLAVVQKELLFPHLFP